MRTGCDHNDQYDSDKAHNGWIVEVYVKVFQVVMDVSLWRSMKTANGEVCNSCSLNSVLLLEEHTCVRVLLLNALECIKNGRW